MTELEQFRAQKDTFFKTHPQSPLLPEQQDTFEGLRYFPENSALHLVVSIEEFADKDRILMQTSTGDVRAYARYGRLRFNAGEQVVELTLYADDDTYFLTFADSLAGEETYGAGRYLEPEPLGEGQFLIDFNLAYNPYCAYNDAWSCPITSIENRLRVPIRAGEKVFKERV
jgi:uncharacterized protein (DUF1684 family)